MLVVDVDALQAVDLLNRIHEVGLGVLFAEDRENVVRVERTIDQSLPSPDVLAFLNVDVHAARDGVFLHCPAIFALDVNLALAFGNFAVLDDAVDFADDGRVTRLAGLEEFNDARETARDVFGLRGFARNLREHVTRLDLVAIGNHQVCAREGMRYFFLCLARRIACTRIGRLVLFIARRKRDDQLRKARHLVHLFFDRDSRLQILELDDSGRFGKDREGVGIPFDHGLAERDRLPLIGLKTSAIHHVVAAFLFAALLRPQRRSSRSGS